MGNYPSFHGSGGHGSKLQCFIWALWDHHQPLTCPAFPVCTPGSPAHTMPPKLGCAPCALFALLQQQSFSTAAGWAVFNYPPWTFVHHNQHLIANHQTNWWSGEAEKSHRREQGLKQEPTPVMGTADGKQLFGGDGLSGRGAAVKAKTSLLSSIPEASSLCNSLREHPLPCKTIQLGFAGSIVRSH